MSTEGIIGYTIMVIIAVAGFIFWHLNSIKKVEDKVDALKDKLKDLEQKDQLQQMAIDQIEKLWPIITESMKRLNK